MSEEKLFQMRIKFAEDIIKEIEIRGQISVPEGNVTGEAFEEWLYEEGDQMKNNVTPLERNEIGQITDARAKWIESSIENVMEIVFDEYNDVFPYDIEFLAHRTIAHMASMETVKLGAKKNEVKGSFH